MSRIAVPSRDEASAEAKPVFDALEKMLGFVPNLHRLMSLSPTVFKGFVDLQNTLSKALDVKTRTAISLAVSEVNGCNYCLAAHTHVATAMTKLPSEEVELNRQGKSGDSKREAAATFARKVIERRGQVSQVDLAAVRQAGFSDSEVLEIVALSAQFLMTNFMNNVADTDIDFPIVHPAKQMC
jgi:uncharacterized peroxidase-related enzyme